MADRAAMQTARTERMLSDLRPRMMPPASSAGQYDCRGHSGLHVTGPFSREQPITFYQPQNLY